jgi:hypothetical protein
LHIRIRRRTDNTMAKRKSTKGQTAIMNHDQGKYQRTGIVNESRSSEMSKVRDMQLTKINWNIKGQGCAMNHNQIEMSKVRDM